MKYFYFAEKLKIMFQLLFITKGMYLCNFVVDS